MCVIQEDLLCSTAYASFLFSLLCCPEGLSKFRVLTIIPEKLLHEVPNGSFNGGCAPGSNGPGAYFVCVGALKDFSRN